MSYYTKNRKIEIEEKGNVEEYIAYEEECEKDVWDSNLCDEDGIPYDMMDEKGDLIE